MAAPDNPSPEAKPFEQAAGYAPTEELLKRRHADTARTLAYVLTGLLAATILLHYVGVAVLLVFNHREDVPILEHVLNVLLPVVSGLAGSATTYYFTREAR